MIHFRNSDVISRVGLLLFDHSIKTEMWYINRLIVIMLLYYVICTADGVNSTRKVLRKYNYDVPNKKTAI